MESYTGLKHNTNVCGHGVAIYYNFCPECGQKVESSLHPNKYIGLLMQKLGINKLSDLDKVEVWKLDKERVLFDAVESGNLDLVQQLINCGADINVPDKNGDSILFSIAGNLDFIKLFFRNGLSIDQVNNYGNIGLIEAYNKSGFETVLYLLEEGLEINRRCANGDTLLYRVIIHGTDSEVIQLLDLGASIDLKDGRGFSPIDAALKQNNLKLAQLMADRIGSSIEKHMNGNLLNELLERDAKEALRFVLSLTNDINVKDKFSQTVLFNKQHDFDAEIFSLLIEKGIDVNARDRIGKSVLHDSTGNLDYMKFLIKNGADVNAEDDLGKTALYVAAGQDNVEVVQFLIENGADIFHRDKHGNSVFQEAFEYNSLGVISYLASAGILNSVPRDVRNKSLAEVSYRGHLNVIRLLVELGTDINHEDYLERTALSVAIEKGHHHIIDYLIKNSKIDISKGKLYDEMDHIKEDINYLFKEKGLTL